MNLIKLRKSFFATATAACVVAFSLTPSLTALATPSTNIGKPTPPIPTPSTEEQVDSAEPETFGAREYYLTEELPDDVVAVNRTLDDPLYGNESFFLSVTDLGEEKVYYDTTDNLTSGENNHLGKSTTSKEPKNPKDSTNSRGSTDSAESAKSTSTEALTLSGGETLRVTIFYHNNNPLLPTQLSVGSFFPVSVEKGMVKTIWGEVYLENPLASNEAAIDRGYNVIPILAEENVLLEYMPNSLVRYDYDETVTQGRTISAERVKTFFLEDPDEIGMPLLVSGNFCPKEVEPQVKGPTYYIGEEYDEKAGCTFSGYVSYKIKVTKAPSVVGSAAEKVKEKASEIAGSEEFERYNNFMTDLGKKTTDGINKWLDKFKD